jgi:hypothetical protein
MVGAEKKLPVAAFLPYRRSITVTEIPNRGIVWGQKVGTDSSKHERGQDQQRQQRGGA